MRYLISLSLLLFTLTANAFFTNKQDFLPVEQAFQLTLIEGEQGEALLNWQITPGYYLYRHSIKALDAQENPIELDIPNGVENEDEFFGKTEIYHNSLRVPVSLSHPQPLQVSWQGCADAGLCYPPQTTELQLAAASTNNNSSPTGGLAEDQSIAARLADAGLLANIGAFFVMGLLLAFTPCMLPMLPILSSVIAGSKPGGWQGARLGAAFVIPMALVYAVLGVIAAQLGNLSAMLQNPWLLIPFASLFVFLALAQFGLFTLQLPGFIRNRLHKQDQQIKGGSMLGAAGLGVFSALLVGPCMTAPLAGALLYISQSGNATTGGLALFSLGIGSGLPLLLAMSFGMRWLPKPGEWMQSINKIFAYALLAAAIFIVRPVIHDSLSMIFWGVLLVAIALQIGTLAHSRSLFVTRLIGLLLGIYASMILFGAASGAHDPLDPLANFKQVPAPASLNTAIRYSDPQAIYQQLDQAKRANQWAILDFYADWCVSCKVMEKTVFAQPEVQTAIAGMRFLQPDVTENNSAQQDLQKKYGIMGPPTILFIAPNGQEVRAARITGEVNAKEFLAHLKLAQETN